MPNAGRPTTIGLIPRSDSAVVVSPDSPLGHELMNGDSPLSSEELQHIYRLTPDATQALWKPDWRESIGWESLSKERRKELQAQDDAEYQQVHGSRRVFLNSYAQLRPDLFPLQAIFSSDPGCGKQTLAGAGIPPDKTQIAYEKCFEWNVQRVRGWLLRRPLRRSEWVYVSNRPDRILLVQWEVFARHWDTFYTSFNRVNVFNDDLDWFLFFHPEDYIIWGCTHDYAQRKYLDEEAFLRPPFSYGEEFAVSLRQLNRRCQRCAKCLVAKLTQERSAGPGQMA